jgi:hypothetical protein
MCRIVLHHLVYPPERFMSETAVFHYYERVAGAKRLMLLRRVFEHLRQKDGLVIELTDRLEPTDHVLRPWYAPSIHSKETICMPAPCQPFRTFSQFFQGLGTLRPQPAQYLLRTEIFDSFQRAVENLKDYEAMRKKGLGGTKMSFWFSMNVLDLQTCIAWLQERHAQGQPGILPFLKQVCWLLHCRLNHRAHTYPLEGHLLQKAERWAEGRMTAEDIVTPLTTKERLAQLSNSFSLAAAHGPMTNAHRLVMSQVLLVHLDIPWWYGAAVWQKLNLDSQPAANGYNWFLQSKNRFIRRYATLKRLEELPAIVPEDYGLSR